VSATHRLGCSPEFEQLDQERFVILVRHHIGDCGRRGRLRRLSSRSILPSFRKRQLIAVGVVIAVRVGYSIHIRTAIRARLRTVSAIPDRSRRELGGDPGCIIVSR